MKKMCEENTQQALKDNIRARYVQFECDKPELKTSNIYETFNLPHRFECSHLFHGYGVQKPKQNPFYKTVNSDYGWFTPSPHTVPHRFFPRSQEFSTNLAKCGMYRNYSLNTVMDKTYH